MENENVKKTLVQYSEINKGCGKVHILSDTKDLTQLIYLSGFTGPQISPNICGMIINSYLIR